MPLWRNSWPWRHFADTLRFASQLADRRTDISYHGRGSTYEGKRTFACGLIDICVQKAISRLIKEQKKRKIMQIFLTKFQFPCAKKTESWKYSKICISKNMRFILGDFRSNVCSYFFHFCIRHANLVFFATFVCWQVWKSANLLILKTMYSLPKFNLWPH